MIATKSERSLWHLCAFYFNTVNLRLQNKANNTGGKMTGQKGNESFVIKRVCAYVHVSIISLHLNMHATLYTKVRVLSIFKLVFISQKVEQVNWSHY